jgi:DNA-binding LacI/PurR family transcriptional regulator
VQDASGAVASVDAEGLEVDDVLGQRAQRDDVAEAAHFAPPLTTVQQDFEQLGRKCADPLMELIADGCARMAVAIDPMRPVVRESTAPLR